MKKVSKSALKAKMFEYFRELEKSGDPIIVTDFGKPVIQIVPYRESKSIAKSFEDLRGQAKLPKAAVLEDTAAEWKDL